jgi:hypothetical protein
MDPKLARKKVRDKRGDGERNWKWVTACVTSVVTERKGRSESCLSSHIIPSLTASHMIRKHIMRDRQTAANESQVVQEDSNKVIRKSIAKVSSLSRSSTSPTTLEKD